MADTDTKLIVDECPDTLSPEHLAQFSEIGCVAFENALTADEITAARSALTGITCQLLERAHRGEAQLRERPDASKNYAGIQVVNPNSGFGIHFEAGMDPLSMPVDEAELKFRKLFNYHREHQTFIDLTQHPRIAGFIAQLIGEEAILKAEMALSKPPLIGSEKPWHQDNAYFNWLPLYKVATAWIVLDDTTNDNGCMHVCQAATDSVHSDTTTPSTARSCPTASTRATPFPCRLKPAALCFSPPCCRTRLRPTAQWTAGARCSSSIAVSVRIRCQKKNSVPSSPKPTARPQVSRWRMKMDDSTKRYRKNSTDRYAISAKLLRVHMTWHDLSQLPNGCATSTLSKGISL